MPSQEGTGSNTTRLESTRLPGLKAYQEVSPPDLSIKYEDNDTKEGDGVDQLEPSRYSTKICKPTALFNPGTGLDRNWSLDIVVSKPLILSNHASKLSNDGTEDIFSSFAQIDYME
eukprot:2694219-Ditylum_brightwellii.AAC.1